ncbi:MAG: GTP cyclohydrolase FolE2 [Bdellovibrionaceae bacterium]|nr:GTP cyclohydrolase FolE2 [Pseudobdellovibrionaceae bacterium]
MSFIKKVPDISQENIDYKFPIDLVGLQDLRLPVRLTDKLSVLAKITLLVSLDNKDQRGIHMSRLYLTLFEEFSKKIVNFSSLKTALQKAIKSQKGDSSSGQIKLSADWPVIRKALKSSIKGWRNYPIYFQVDYSKNKSSFKYMAGGEVLYSSTCPCSTSLSAQIIKQDFEKKFSNSKTFNKKEVLSYLSDKSFLTATPHAQKSSAFFKLQLKESSKNRFSFLKLIDDIEKSLGTAVQTAVKREDEAEFAKRNAQNLMFCEDAVRRLAMLFNDKKDISDFLVRVQHYESLHPFTVESSISKGVKGGLKA